MFSRVQAYIHADNYFLDATFDATPWFEQASDEEIEELAKAGWTGSVADTVAQFAENYSELVGVVLDYCRRKDAQGRPVGFTVEVHGKTALDWLREHRTHLADRLESSK